MARQFIYHMRGPLEDLFRAGKIRCWITCICPSTRMPRSGCSAPTGGQVNALRIMAGLDKGMERRGLGRRGAKVGYLPQEPRLENDKTVRENVELGVAELRVFSSATMISP